MNRFKLLLTFFLVLIDSSCSSIPFDLTHPIKSTDPIFPGLNPFRFTEQFSGWKLDENNRTYFQSLNYFSTVEHFGTHIDAPRHGAFKSWTLDEIPLERLVSIRATIVDVSKVSANEKNYLIQISDIDENLLDSNKDLFVLLFYTGRSKHWPHQRKYAGGSKREELDFPGLSPELATYLVEKYSSNLVAVGIDTLSIDAGSAIHFHVHRILFEANIYGLENVANLSQILDYLGNNQRSFFDLDVLPIKIHGGTGGPCRIIARLPEKHSSTPWFILLALLIFIIGLFVISIKSSFSHDV